MNYIILVLSAIGGICLGVTLIGITICTWFLIFNLIKGLLAQTPKRFELVEDGRDEKKTTTSTRRNRTETTNN